MLVFLTLMDLNFFNLEYSHGSSLIEYMHLSNAVTVCSSAGRVHAHAWDCAEEGAWSEDVASISPLLLEQ